MGNLNQFYVMGRLAARPRVESAEGEPRVLLSLLPGTGARAPRGVRIDPLELLAVGPQAPVAEALQEGQAVLLRGQLRQEAGPEGAPGRLTARVQAIELLAEGGLPRPRYDRSERGEEEGAEPGASGRRRRRRRRRPGGPRPGEGGGEGAGEGAAEAGEAAPPAEGPPPAPARPLPPPKPIAEAPPKPAPPDPTYKADMPF